VLYIKQQCEDWGNKKRRCVQENKNMEYGCTVENKRIETSTLAFLHSNSVTDRGEYKLRLAIVKKK
jgi:hypothetical protein